MADSYLDLADGLARQLTTAEPGTRVVSEHELARASGVSRPTARAALQELERRYLVRRVRGAGTFVHRRLDYVIGPDTPPSWSESIRGAGSTPSSKVAELRIVEASEGVRRRLELDDGDDARVVLLRRATYVDGLPAGLGTSCLPASLVPGLSEHLAAGTVDGSIYRTLVDRYRFEPVRSWTSASLEVPTPEVAAQLGLEAPEPTWFTESVNRDRASWRPVELSRGWMRADVYRVILELGHPTTSAEPGR